MVMANLHLICGNCGSNKHLSWQSTVADFSDPEDIQPSDIMLACGNCGTLHFLNEYAKNKNPWGE